MWLWRCSIHQNIIFIKLSVLISITTFVYMSISQAPQYFKIHIIEAVWGRGVQKETARGKTIDKPILLIYKNMYFYQSSILNRIKYLRGV